MADRVIAVFGATGAQGGGLARAILEDPQRRFRVRAVTRKPESEAARSLAQAGAEVIAANLDDASSVARAMQDVHGAYCVTNFWEHFSPELELAQARILAVAAQAQGVSHVVWSTLEDTRRFIAPGSGRMPVLMGRYNVPHFDAKGEANALFTDRVPTTLFHTSFYWDNLVGFGMGPKRGNDGSLTFTLPMGEAKLAGMAAADIGRCAFGVFCEGSAWINKSVGVAGGHLTGDDMAHALTRALGKPVRYFAMPFDQYRALGFPGAEDLGNMFQFYHDFEDAFCAARPLDVSRRLNPRLQTFDQWLDANASRIAAG